MSASIYAVPLYHVLAPRLAVSGSSLRTAYSSSVHIQVSYDVACIYQYSSSWSKGVLVLVILMLALLHTGTAVLLEDTLIYHYS